MSDARKADASDWAWLEGNSTVNRCDAAWSRGLIELRARIETLEEQQRATVKESLTAQPGGLVERVAMTIGPISEGGERAGILPVGTAIAVLRQIAAHARAQDLNGQSVHVMTWEGVAQWLEQEANHA